MIRSHIIPKFYLEQFASPSTRGKAKPGRIWVYEKGKQPHQRSTTVQGVEKGYFGFVRPDGSLEESLEKHLADREEECGEVLACAKSELFDWTSAASRNKLAFYAGLLFARATQRKNLTVEYWADIQVRFKKLIREDQYVNDLAVRYRKMYQEATPAAVRKRLLELAEEMKRDASSRNAFLSDLLGIAEFIKGILVTRPWGVWRAPEACEFITSDNPLVTFLPVGREFAPGHGFGVPGVVAAFPLGPSTALIIGIPGRWESCTIDPTQVDRLNELIIRLSDRFVYSRTRSSRIQEMADNYSGSAKYGRTAFTRAGLKMPDMEDFMRRGFGLGPPSTK